MNKISSHAAKLQGLPFYFTGKSCKNNHISKRRVANSTCIECEQEYRNARDNEKNRTYRKKYRNKINANQSERYYTDINYRQQLKINNQRWRYNNRGIVAKNSMKHYVSNRGQHNARTAKYRSAKLQATPSWYENSLIRQLYTQARFLTDSTHISHQVDHIVPLQGELVCGLHCIDNLQIITASDNKSKSNKFKI